MNDSSRCGLQWSKQRQFVVSTLNEELMSSRMWLIEWPILALASSGIIVGASILILGTLTGVALVCILAIAVKAVGLYIFEYKRSNYLEYMAKSAEKEGVKYDSE